MYTVDQEYNDLFTGEPKTKRLYFSMRKSTVMENLDIQTEAQAIKDMYDEPERQITPEEIRRIFKFVRRIAGLSYGIKEGESFYQGEEVWRQFEASAAYDDWMMSLFTDPKKANAFVEGVMPKDFLKEIEDARAEQSGDAPEDNRPAWERENREPNAAELQTMTKEQLQVLYRKKASS